MDHQALLKHLPQSELNSVRPDPFYKIVSYLPKSDEYVINLSPATPEALNTTVPGHKVEFYDEDTNKISVGLVRSVNRDRRNALVSSDKQVEAKTTTCKISRWADLFIPKTRLVSESAFIESVERSATLEAFCRYTEPYIKGSISWSLYYQNNDDATLLIEGNDFETPGLCTFTKEESLWKAGDYRLEAVRRFRGITIKRDGMKWTLNEPKSKLSCGGYHSNAVSLSL